MMKLTSILLATVMVAFFNRAPMSAGEKPVSGLRVGDQVEPWNPYHVAGPDKGTNTCPVCTYLEKPVVIAFAKDTANTIELAGQLETLARQYRDSGLRVVIAITDASPERVKEIAIAAKTTNSSLCYLTAKTGAKELKAYQINPQSENTIMVYKNYSISATIVNLPARDTELVAAAVKKLLP